MEKKIEELYKIYKDIHSKIPNNQTPLATLEEFYEWNTDEDGINYENVLGDIENYIDGLGSIPAPPPPKISVKNAKSKLKRYDESEEYKQNQQLIAEQEKEIMKQRTEMQQMEKRIAELTKQNKELSSKLIVEGIKSKLPIPYPSINEIPKAPSAEPKLPKAYGESDEFKKSHRNLTFKEYRDLNKHSNKKIQDMIIYLNSDSDSWQIDFQPFNEDALKELEPYFIKWFEDKIQFLNWNDKYMFHFKVGNVWHSKPMSENLFNQLYDNLKNGTLIYDMDKMPTWEYDKGDNNNQLPEWSMFNAISISKVKKFKKVKRDNGGHFFPYLKNYTKYQRVNDFFKRLQIFDSLVSPTNNNKKFNYFKMILTFHWIKLLSRGFNFC